MHLQRMSRFWTNHPGAANGSSKSLCVSESAMGLTVSIPSSGVADGLFEGSRQVLDEWFDQHPGGIGGNHNDLLSSLRQTIPLGVGPVEYPILLQRTEIRNRSGIGLRNVGRTRAIIRLPDLREQHRFR